jgi:4-hydroxybenzoate polyprenyltransferase
MADALLPDSAESARSSDQHARPWWKPFADLIRLSNQTGTLLLMLPTWWTLVLASRGRPSLGLLAVFAAGSFLMRSAGVVLNDLTDRRFDREVARTRDRPLASGQLTAPQAFLTTAVLITLAGALLLLLNRSVWALSPVAVLLATLYPFSKRFLSIPQLVLGLAFGWGVVMAWASVRGTVETPAWLLYAATVCWAVAYDTIYAMQDRDDDARIGLYSSALLFGEWVWFAVAMALAAMLALLAEAGQLMNAGTFFYVSLLGVAALFARQVRELRGGIEAPRAFVLFKQHIWAGCLILVGLWLGLL